MISSIITLVIFFVLLCSGGALVCALDKGNFEDALPLTCTGIVLIGFVFGVVGLLPAGFYVTLAAAVEAFAAAVYFLVRRGTKNFMSRFFSPGFFLFAALYVFLVVINYGMRLSAWDEFSHWGDIVKVMTTLGGFGTVPLSDSMFPDYPPAMSLFQYCCSGYMLVSGESMAEWILYFAYQILMFALFFPFLKRFDLKRLWGWSFLAVIWCLPLVFQSVAYSRIYIDPFLSVLLALGLAHALIDREVGTRLDRLNLAAILILLPLTKSLGLPFAIIVLLTVFMTESMKKQRGYRRRCVLYTCAALIPRLIWELHVKLNHAKATGGASMAIVAEHLGDSDYTSAILREYLKALVQKPLTDEEAIAPQLCALVLLALLMAALWLTLKKEKESRDGDKLYSRAFVLMLVVNIAFFVMNGALFVYAMPEHEAVELISMERYLNNILMADAVLALMLTADLIRRGAVSMKRAAAVVIAAALLFTPIRPAARVIARRNVKATQTLHRRFEPYYETLNALTQGERCDILFATDWSDTIEFMLLRTELRPSYIEMTPLPESVARFDYVVIYNLASPPEGTENGGIYAVNGEELIRVN